MVFMLLNIVSEILTSRWFRYIFDLIKLQAIDKK